MEEKKEGEAMIIIGNTEFKKDRYKERNLRKRFSVGKYLRWDVDEKKWRSNLKWLEKELQSGEMKKIHALTFQIFEHGECDTIGIGINDKIDIRKRFYQIVDILKQHYLNNTDNKIYFKVKSCHGAYKIRKSNEAGFNEPVKDIEGYDSKDIFYCLKNRLGDDKTKQVYCSYNITGGVLLENADGICYSPLEEIPDELQDINNEYLKKTKKIKNKKEKRKVFAEILSEKNEKMAKKLDGRNIDNNFDYSIIVPSRKDCFYMCGSKTKKYVSLEDYNRVGPSRLEIDHQINNKGPEQKKKKDEWLRNVKNKQAEIKKSNACCFPWF